MTNINRPLLLLLSLSVAIIVSTYRQFKPATFTPNGEAYFIILPHKDGSAGTFQHIAMINSSEDLDVRSLVHVYLVVVVVFKLLHACGSKDWEGVFVMM